MYTRTSIKYLTLLYLGTDHEPSTQLGTLLTNLFDKPTNVVPNRVGTYYARHIVLLSVCLNNSVLNGPSITHQRTRVAECLYTEYSK